MMVSLVAVLAALSMLNLGLVLLAINRVNSLARNVQPGDLMPSLGRQVTGFRAIAVDGQALTTEALSDGCQHVAFLSDSCEPCLDVAADLRTHNGYDVDWTIFLAVGGTESSSGARIAADDLREVGAVAILGELDGVLPAFGGIPMFPTMLRLEDGKVVAASPRPADVAQSSAAVH